MRLRITVNGMEGSKEVADAIKETVAQKGYTVTREHLGKIGERIESVILEIENQDGAAPNAA